MPSSPKKNPITEKEIQTDKVVGGDEFDKKIE